jgi:5'-3' exonuclease
MIVIDYSAISIANIAIQKLEPNEDLFRAMILNSIRMYRKKYGAEYGEIVLAADAGGNWRKEYYPEYKATRQSGRKESPLDWNAIFKILNQVLDEIKESFPYTVIGQEGMEADDIIAQLVYKTQEFGEHEPVMIISGDKDFAQLQKFSNVSQWSPITKKLIKEPDPYNKLKEHIFRGDGSDGVPNILSCDDVFLQEGLRQTPLTKKKIEVFMNAKDVKEVMTEDEYRNYIRNKKMIDLEECPEHFKNIVYIEYDKQKLSQPKNKPKVMPYFIKHRCKNLLTNIQEFI